MKNNARLPQTLDYPVEVDVVNVGYNADAETKLCENVVEDCDDDEIESRITKEVKKYVFKKRPEDNSNKLIESKGTVTGGMNDHRKTSETQGFAAKKPAVGMKKTQSVQTTKTNIRAKQIDENVNYTNFKNIDIVTVCKFNSETKTYYETAE